MLSNFVTAGNILHIYISLIRIILTIFHIGQLLLFWMSLTRTISCCFLTCETQTPEIVFPKSTHKSLFDQKYSSLINIFIYDFRAKTRQNTVNEQKSQKIKPRFKGLSFYLNIFLSWFCLLRRREPAEEEDGLGFIVPDEEEEGVVCCEVFLPQHTAITYHACCGRRRLRALLVHLHEGLVGHGRQEEILLHRSCQTGRPLTRRTRPSCPAWTEARSARSPPPAWTLAGERWIVWVDVHVFPVGPFIQPLLRQLLLQLERSKYILSRLYKLRRGCLMIKRLKHLMTLRYTTEVMSLTSAGGR